MYISEEKKLIGSLSCKLRWYHSKELYTKSLSTVKHGCHMTYSTVISGNLLLHDQHYSPTSTHGKYLMLELPEQLSPTIIPPCVTLHMTCLIWCAPWTVTRSYLSFTLVFILVTTKSCHRWPPEGWWAYQTGAPRHCGCGSGVLGWSDVLLHSHKSSRRTAFCRH